MHIQNALHMELNWGANAFHLGEMYHQYLNIGDPNIFPDGRHFTHVRISDRR